MYKKPKTGLALPIFLMIAPILSLILGLMLWQSLSAAVPADENLFGDPHPLTLVANVMIFAGVITFIPCLIIGAVIFGRRRHKRRLTN